MTDVSSLPAHADPQPSSVGFDAGPPPPAFANPSPGLALDGAVDNEESSTIKCICSFSDDDGNTVLCEKCDTWQHIVCYYESTQHVPDVHECTDCQPRSVDARRATEKQRLRREVHNIGERKGRPKTSTNKSHKKRPKDPLSATQPNGWPPNPNNDLHYNPERKSGSPRDQPPPNKRPKTTHRQSGSVSAVSQPTALAPAGRKRGASFATNGHSPVIKSPTALDGPMEDFSLEFMNLYTQPEPPSADGNSYTSLGVASDIAMWLKDPDALAEASGGKKPQDLFSRIENTIEDLEKSTAPVITKQTEVDSAITAHGLNPQWHLITVETPVPDGGYIGELKGLVGRKVDYHLDTANRWSLLRHPEPFVFFPPYLPIYIDTRQEGNILRYARRSCSPNMAMKILVESSNDYHFCFVALRQIDPGEELTIGWDIDSEVQKQLAKVVTNGAKEGFRRIQPWVSCVLANFGGCACNNSAGHECLLERARRNTMTDPAQPRSKSKKAKKAHASPLSTGRATNSRAGSETMNRDVADDDNMDSRSTSGSHKSSSRDITPATHFSVDGDLKMSDREKRKLQQQERLFEQLEFDEQHKGKKVKRNSAGSTLNTPSLSSSVRRMSRPSLLEANLDVQKRLGHSEVSPSARHREHSHGVARKTSGSSTKTNGRGVPKPKPVYKEASTQTEDNGGVAIVHGPARTRDMKPPLSFKRKLLQQAQEDKLQRERIRSTSVKMENKSPGLRDVSSSKPSPLPLSPPQEDSSAMDITMDTEPATQHKELTPAKEPSPAASTADIEMADADVVAPRTEEPTVEPMVERPKTEEPKADVHKAEEPKADEFKSEESKAEEPKSEELENEESKVDEFKVDEPKSELEPEPKPKADETTIEESRVEEMPDAPAPEPPLPEVSDPPTQPSALSRTASPPRSPQVTNSDTDAPKMPVSLTVEMSVKSEKPELTNPFSGNPAISPGTVRTGSNGTIRERSPSSFTIASPFSPAVTSAVNPTPARKKLSLSDYTSRRAKLAQTTSTGTPPLANSQSTSSPTLSAASLPNIASPSGKSAESLPIVAEEPQPLDLEAPAAVPVAAPAAVPVAAPAAAPAATPVVASTVAPSAAPSTVPSTTSSTVPPAIAPANSTST
jgi:hypothetical protein